MSVEDSQSELGVEQVRMVEVNRKEFQVGIYGGGTLGILLGNVPAEDLEDGEIAVHKALNPDFDETAPVHYASSRSEERIDVMNKNQWYNYRLIGTQNAGKARCMNYAFFRAGGSNSLGGLDTLRSETSVSYTGNKATLQSLKLSYRVRYEVLNNTSHVSSLNVAQAAGFTITNLSTRDTMDAMITSPEYTANWETASPVYSYYSPEIIAANADLKGGHVTQAYCQVIGSIKTANQAFNPTATVTFALLCYAS